MNAQHVIEERILAQHRAIADRLTKEPGLLEHARANLMRWETRYREEDRPLWIAEWHGILDSPIEKITAVLTERSEHAKWLRSCSPFAGVLSPRERWQILKEIDRAQA